MIPGETVASGAKPNCLECGKHLEMQVVTAGAAPFIGFFCNEHGVHTRETEYFRTEQEAEDALEEFWSTGKMRGLRT